MTVADIAVRYGRSTSRAEVARSVQPHYRRLRSGLYVHEDRPLRGDIDLYSIANRLYSPSYVSLYSALQYYSLIPEQVYEVTSISTRKTKRMEVGRTRYSYRHLKPSLFFGYEPVPWLDDTYNIAYPEKVLLDFAYLEPNFSDSGWLEGLRLDEFTLREDLNWYRMYLFALAFGSQTVLDRIVLLIKTYEL